jgi:hypothetical protein
MNTGSTTGTSTGEARSQPWLKCLTIMVNSIYNGWRFEDGWRNKSRTREV